MKPVDISVLFAAMESGLPQMPKAGGEYDYNECLLPALAGLGVEASCISPNWGNQITGGVVKTEFSIQLGFGAVRMRIRQFQHKGAIYYLIEDPRNILFTGSKEENFGLYQHSDGFRALVEGTILPKCAVALSKLLNVKLIKAQDWQAALIPVYLKTTDQLGPQTPRTIFISHNLAYKGIFSEIMKAGPHDVRIVEFLLESGVLRQGENLFEENDEKFIRIVNRDKPSENLFNLPGNVLTKSRDHRGLEYFGKVALVKGAEFADQFVAVSESNLEEMMLSDLEGGAAFGLEGTVRRFRDEGRTGAVFNGGIDIEKINRALAGDGYSMLQGSKTIEVHAVNRQALLRQLRNGIGLNNLKSAQLGGISQIGGGTFLVGSIGRLTPIKGISDIGPEFLESYRRERGPHGQRMHLIILGSAQKGAWEDEEIERQLVELSMRYSDCFSLLIGNDIELANRIYAGIDAFIMPSRSEPAGIAQQAANQCGTPVIAPLRGGLKDFFYIWGGVGFPYSASVAQSDGERRRALLGAIRAAATVYWTRPNEWKKLVEKAAAYDASWQSRAEAYVASIYGPALRRELQN